jgi:type I restriction enzyme, R subunit
MSDAELSFRSQDDYISKYRRVLEHFDAVKIGLTATPALHTVDIFGKPVYTYPYRDAVIDGWLVDHEPSIQITTALSQTGITFGKGESVEMIDSRSGEVDLAELPDELHYNVEEFNKLVVTQTFNGVVAEELAKHIDPSLPGKTLVFAVNDAHADIVVAELKKTFRSAYGEVEDAAIRKITGSVDRVGSLILSFSHPQRLVYEAPRELCPLLGSPPLSTQSPQQHRAGPEPSQGAPGAIRGIARCRKAAHRRGSPFAAMPAVF